MLKFRPVHLGLYISLLLWFGNTQAANEPIPVNEEGGGSYIRS
jgi:hypothetical protein